MLVSTWSRIPREKVAPMIAILSVTTGGCGWRGLRAQRPPGPGRGAQRCVLLRDDCLHLRSAQRRRRYAIHRTGEQGETVGLGRLRAVCSSAGCCHNRPVRGIRLGLGLAGFIGLLVGGVALLGVWSAQQLRASNAAPLVELRLLRHPAVLSADTCTMTLWISVVICAIAAVLTYLLPARGQKVAKGEPEDQIRLLEETEGDACLALDEKG
jgi:hypothetical protein